jgi:hypothetical protein
MAWFNTTCNLMTGVGFDTGFMGGFSMAWIGVVILFFIIALTRKWIGEEMGMPFSFIGGLVVGILPYFLAIYFTCSYKIALVIGIVGAAIGGFLLENVFGGGDGGFGG